MRSNRCGTLCSLKGIFLMLLLIGQTRGGMKVPTEENLMVVIAAEDSAERRSEEGGNGLEQKRSSPQDLVSDIHCLQTAKVETFSALLKLPVGFSSQPVLEERPKEGQEENCIVTETNVKGVYALDLDRLSDCGVRECPAEQGESWLCLLIRFPVMAGLKLPEDAVVDIKCKPQDRFVQGKNVIDFQKNTVEHMSPTVYLGGGHNFLSEIGIFRKLAGTDLFASRVKSGSTIELGENVQLRSIVRAGDGWNFAKITDVLVHRVHSGQAMQGERHTARLVTADGCRNPSYRVLAPLNPWRDAGNPLVSNFDFRVFMFQDMEADDDVMITAKVVACVEEIDCAPTRCDQDADTGYGRRRRGLDNVTEALPGKTKNWEENLELKIRLPHDLVAGSQQHQQQLTESECKLYLVVTLAVALTFCVLSASVVLVACVRRCQLAKNEVKKDAEKEEEEGRSMEERELTYDKLSSFSQPCLLRPGCSGLRTPVSAPSHAKPVTVRSVKRRDKAKVEEKNSRMLLVSGDFQTSNHASKSAAIMKEEMAVMV